MLIESNPKRCNKFPVIFLDFDGVLATSCHLDVMLQNHQKTTDIFGRLFDPVCVKHLEWLLLNCNCQIVVTSDWRNYLCLWQLKLMWKWRKLPGRIISVTPRCSVYRGVEIAKWLHRHKRFDKYVIIDDMDYNQFLESQAQYLVTTDHYKGLTRASAESALKIIRQSTNSCESKKG